MVGSLDDEEVRHRQTRSDREKVVQEKERLEQVSASLLLIVNITPTRK